MSSSERRGRPSIAFIVAAVLIDMMGVGLIVPVLPTLVGTFTKSVESQAYWYAALTLTFGITQFACAPLLGALSDRYGRRLVLLLSIGGLGTMFLLAGLVRSLPALVAARVVGGALASNQSVANAYVADITPPEKRSTSFGIVGAASGVGFILGPMVGGLVGGISVRLPFFVAAGLACINFLYGLFVLPESLAPERRRPLLLQNANPFRALAGLARLEGVGMLVAVIALVNLGQYVVIGTWVLSNSYRYEWGPAQNGASFFVAGLVAAGTQGGLLGWLLKKLGEERLVLVGVAASTFVYVGYGLATHGWMIYVLLIANLLGWAVGAALNAMVSKAAPPDAQGLAMGALSSLNSVVAILGPAVGIPLFARVSRFPRTDFRVGAAFYLAATLSALAFVLASVCFSRSRPRSHASQP